MTLELYERLKTEDDPPLTAETIAAHYQFHTSDELQAHTIVNEAQSWLAKVIVSIGKNGLKDRNGKRAADGEAIKHMERATKAFLSLRQDRQHIIKGGKVKW